MIRALPFVLLLLAPEPTRTTIAALDPAEVGARGAAVPFDEYEAENAVTTGTPVGPDRTFGTLAAEASGRRAVRLEGRQTLSITLARAANALTVRYAIPDGAEGSLGVFAGGERIATLPLTARHGWYYGRYPFTNAPGDGGGHHFFDHARALLSRTVAPGETVTFRLEGSARWVAVDLADFEQAAPPLIRPPGARSLLDFGADPSGRRDSTAALRRAVAAARGRTLWLPPGTFRITGHVEIDRVTIQGAGMWHSILRGAGAGLYGKPAPGGSHAVTLRDFAIVGDVTERKDHLPLSGIGGAMSDSVIERLWLQHHKVGLWFDGPMRGIRISGLRIFDMTADGLNFHRGVSDARVEHSFIRGTGDDGLAAWSGGEADHDIVFRRNTVIAPVLANGIAIYGGRDMVVEGNLIADTLTQGGGIHLGNRFKAVPLSGRFSIANNLLVRAGSFDPNWRYGVGALWFYALDAPIDARIEVTGLEVRDSSEEAVMFTGSSVSGVIVRGMRVSSPGGAVVALRSQGMAGFEEVEATGLKGPAILACNPAFRLAWDASRAIMPCAARAPAKP